MNNNRNTFKTKTMIKYTRITIMLKNIKTNTKNLPPTVPINKAHA